MSDLTIDTISAALRGLAARQGVIAQNLANSETPNYIAGQVSFEDQLKSAIAGNGDPSQITPQTTNSNTPTDANGNNVRIDDETVTMVETSLRYQLMTQAATNKFSILHSAIGRV